MFFTYVGWYTGHPLKHPYKPCGSEINALEPPGIWDPTYTFFYRYYANDWVLIISSLFDLYLTFKPKFHNSKTSTLLERKGTKQYRCLFLGWFPQAYRVCNFSKPFPQGKWAWCSDTQMLRWLFLTHSYLSFPGIRTEQDLFVRLIDSMTKQVSNSTRGLLRVLQFHVWLTSRPSPSVVTGWAVNTRSNADSIFRLRHDRLRVLAHCHLTRSFSLSRSFILVLISRQRRFSFPVTHFYSPCVPWSSYTNAQKSL